MSPNAKGKVVIDELPENDDQGAKVEGQVHVESPSKNMKHVNDEPIGEYMSLILFWSKNDTFSQSIQGVKLGIPKEDGSTDIQEAPTSVHIDEMNGVREATTSVEKTSTILKDATTPRVNNDDQQLNELFNNLIDNLIRTDEDDAEYEGDGESEEGNLKYKKDDESQESDPKYEEGDESQESDPEYEEDGKQIEDEDQVDDI
ncbi:unnamed protein product [Lactuca saligna]|uniref:Uncharacterized protein n=1 Tax=Lactuca saligna TaxID=75948 RepID=A0AA36DX22_LACSI|nr:unnamed protein product [Lactuca saligna]